MASTSPPELKPPRPAPPAAPPKPRLGERVAVIAALLAAYVVIGWWAVVDHNLVMGDAISRYANAVYALDSRFPHFAAIGFVWGPIPTMAMMPVQASGLLATHRFFIPSVGSIIGMSLAVTALISVLAQWGCSRRLRLAAGALFAFNPLILFYAVNGMSEAWFLLFLILAISRLFRWYESRGTADLAITGIWLGVGYLVRYEALAATGTIAASVALHYLYRSFKQTHPGERMTMRIYRSARRVEGDIGADLALLVMPVIAAFGVFAAISWILTGQAFAQFSSTYGNSNVLATTGHGSTGVAAVGFIIGEFSGAGPMAIIALVVAVFVLRGKDLSRLWAAVVTFGGVLALSALLQYEGKTLPFLRFWITTIPLQTMAGALIVKDLAARWVERTATTAVTRQWRRRVALGAASAALASVSLTFVGTAAAMASSTFGVQEHQIFSVFDPNRDRFDERQTLLQFDTERQIASYLDALNLPRASVLVDVLDGFPIVAASDDPQMFVIPSDYDFAQDLSAPAAHGVKYLLTIPPVGRGAADALNTAYPNIYYHGLPGSHLVLQAVTNDVFPNWRLWELYPRPERS